MTAMANVIPLAPRIREREVQAALDQAAAARGWPPDPWRLRLTRKTHRRRGIGTTVPICPPRLRLVRP